MQYSTLDAIVDNFRKQFSSRILTKASDKEFSAVLVVEDNETETNFVMTRNEFRHVLSIPKTFVKNNVKLIRSNGIDRAVGKYYWKIQERLLSFEDVMFEILFGYPVHMLPEYMTKSNSSTMQQIKYAYENDKLSITLHSIQKRINYIVNYLPIHETDFNSFIMNHRIMIFDPNFDSLTDPEDQHNYQVEKNKEYFHKNWSSLGLSDGSLAGKNYILDYDLRKLSPFGSNFHNPQRNLYSTLGMQGDELPLVHSEETFRLASLGLTRKGWNLFTIFVDIPDVWEDQLMVDIRHADKFVTYTKRYSCFGDLLVRVGDKLDTDDQLYVNKLGEIKTFDVQCDSAEVESIELKEDTVGGVSFPTNIVTIKYRRNLKDGTKLTNLAANKGVIRMRDLGYALNPATGQQQKIDVIVSAKAVLKRKNYTQILEALLNNLNGNNTMVVPTDAVVTTESLEPALKSIGYNTDGTWLCKTYAGNFKCVAGNVFWGVTHDADDTVWKPLATKTTNSRGIREAGLKFSNIEFRALTTRFGADNPVEKEILQYAQGFQDVKELIKVLKYQFENVSTEYSVKNVMDIVPINQAEGIMILPEDLVGTIADPELSESGFMLKLPVEYQIVLDHNYEILASGFPGVVGDYLGATKVAKIISLDSIYVPYDNLRQCWKHDVGRVGLNDLGSALNTIVVMAHNYVTDKTTAIHTTMLYKAIGTYFNIVANKLSTKRGELSVHAMSVRYPHSAKGVATLSNVLPKNTIEIHATMANDLKLVDGDIVLVERFPCLGFMSLRPQKVKITEDPLCKFSIRVSGNSLGSLSLDFDGDVLYIAAFYSKEAIEALHREFYTPNEYCIKHINAFNEKMGKPREMEMVLEDYKITPFQPLTNETHAEIVNKLTGVKSNTGPVVALAYNLLRIMENSEVSGNRELECEIEVFIDTVANSVFKQKHGVKSLHKVVTDAVCSADLAILIQEGFNPKISEIICNQIITKAAEIGVKNVAEHHRLVMLRGGSSIINKIVKRQNILYYTSRANLEGSKIFKNLADHTEVDIPSKIFNKIMSLNHSLQPSDHKALAGFKSPESRVYCAEVLKSLNTLIN
jgi:hypothetical protein